LSESPGFCANRLGLNGYDGFGLRFSMDVPRQWDKIEELKKMQKTTLVFFSESALRKNT